MDRNKELFSIIEGLSRHLEFLEYAGVKDLPASAWSPPPQPASKAEEPVAAPVRPPVMAQETGPVLLRIWRLGGAVAFVEGVGVSEKGAKPFTPEHIEQFEKLAAWMSRELGMGKGFSADGGWTRECPTPGAGKEAVEGELRANPPRMAVILGPVAAALMLGSPDIKALRARFHDFGGVSAVATHSPGAILKSKALKLKKEVHNDLLMALGSLK